MRMQAQAVLLCQSIQLIQHVPIIDTVIVACVDRLLI